MDASLSGETRALLFAKGFLYSAHMDGSIKVSFLLHLDFCFCWWKWKGLLLAAHYRSLTSGFRFCAGLTEAWPPCQIQFFSAESIHIYIQVWDTRRREPQLLKEVKAHLKPALCLAYLQSANQLSTGSADKTIRVFDLTPDLSPCSVSASLVFF
jgi:WD40 repeat protein